MDELQKQVGIGLTQAEHGDFSDRTVLDIAHRVMTEGDRMTDTETAFKKLMGAIHEAAAILGTEDIEGAVGVVLVDYRPQHDIQTVERSVSAIIEAVAAEQALVSVVQWSIRDEHPSSVVLASALERFEKAQAAKRNSR